MNSTTTSWENSTNFTDNPGSFLDIHKKCMNVFPKSFLGWKVDATPFNNNSSRLSYYQFKNWKGFGGLFQHEFDETSRFQLFTVPRRDGSRYSMIRLQKRTSDSSFDIGILPALHLNYFYRIKNASKLFDSPLFRNWISQNLKVDVGGRLAITPKEAYGYVGLRVSTISQNLKVDVGGRLAITPKQAYGYVGLRVSTSNHEAAVVLSPDAITSSLLYSSDDAQYGITIDTIHGNSVATFGIKRKFPRLGFSNAFSCSTDGIVRCQFEQKLPLNIPLKFVVSYAFQIEEQKDALGIGMIIKMFPTKKTKLKFYNVRMPEPLQKAFQETAEAAIRKLPAEKWKMEIAKRIVEGMEKAPNTKDGPWHCAVGAKYTLNTTTNENAFFGHVMVGPYLHLIVWQTIEKTCVPEDPPLDEG
uniref:Uncharacterized protein n=1 Tax=Panagrolaimus sp. JU765 TaxID=591449 RepID=A0AC34QJ05_9BILA